ncbi:unnamed protein product [Gadus morhua 'NCC']
MGHYMVKEQLITIHIEKCPSYTKDAGSWQLMADCHSGPVARPICTWYLNRLRAPGGPATMQAGRGRYRAVAMDG